MRAASIDIQLKPRDKPCELPEEYQRSLRNELQVRYLESIGAAPTKANLAMVRKHIPPEKCKFTTAWKSRGWVSDTLYISVEDPSQSAPVLATRRAAAAIADLGAIDRLPAAILEGALNNQGEAAPFDEFEDDDEDGQHSVQLGAPKGSMSFEDAQRSFLYPYRHVVAPRGQRARVGESPTRRRGGSSPEHAAGGPSGASRADDDAHATHEYGDDDGFHYDEYGPLPAPRGTYNFSSRDTQRYAPFTEREIFDELATPLEIHTRDIAAIQADFLSRFPFDTIRGKLLPSDGGGGGMGGGGGHGAHSAPPLSKAPSAASAATEPLDVDPIEAAVREELLSPRTARFIGMLALFLYWAYMPERCQVPRDDAKLGKLLCAVQNYFAALRRRMMRKRKLLLVVLPALLLSVRVAIEGLFRAAFKKWWTTLDGKTTLVAMDQTIEELLDPNQYHSHISALESSTDAIKIASRSEHTGVKPRGDRQARYYTTSTLISTALPKAPLVRQRKTLVGAGLPAAERDLARIASTSVRQSLLQAARSRPSAAEVTADGTRYLEGMVVRPGAAAEARAEARAEAGAPSQGRQARR